MGTHEIHLFDGNKLIQAPSENHPNHSMNKGYLCSPNHEMGFNQFLSTIMGQDFYTIFDPIVPIEKENEDEKDHWKEEQWFEYEHPIYPKEHLEKALVRVKKAISTLKTLPDYGIKTIETYAEAPTLTTQETFQWVLKENKKQNNYVYESKHESGGSGTGWFAFDRPLRIVAIVPYAQENEFPGYVRKIFPMMEPSTQGVHVIYEVEGLMNEYIAIAEITQEFIEKALTLKEPRIGAF